ncbi:unnamed protein product, partial [Brassica rapa subsp. narinosa]
MHMEAHLHENVCIHRSYISKESKCEHHVAFGQVSSSKDGQESRVQDGGRRREKREH